MKEESKNDLKEEIFESDLKNPKVEVEATVNAISEEVKETEKREYTFDTPENRSEIVRRIDRTFTTPIVLNFSTRQEQISEQLDSIRSELYDEKMDIERISDEIRNTDQAKLDHHSQVTRTKSNLLNNTFKKKDINLGKSENISSGHSTQLPNKKEFVLQTPKAQPVKKSKINMEKAVTTEEESKKDTKLNSTVKKNLSNYKTNTESKKKEDELNQTTKKRPTIEKEELNQTAKKRPITAKKEIEKPTTEKKEIEKPTTEKKQTTHAEAKEKIPPKVKAPEVAKHKPNKTDETKEEEKAEKVEKNEMKTPSKKQLIKKAELPKPPKVVKEINLTKTEEAEEKKKVVPKKEPKINIPKKEKEPKEADKKAEAIAKPSTAASTKKDTKAVGKKPVKKEEKKEIKREEKIEINSAVPNTAAENENVEITNKEEENLVKNEEDKIFPTIVSEEPKVGELKDEPASQTKKETKEEPKAESNEVLIAETVALA